MNKIEKEILLITEENDENYQKILNVLKIYQHDVGKEIIRVLDTDHAREVIDRSKENIRLLLCSTESAGMKENPQVYELVKYFDKYYTVLITETGEAKKCRAKRGVNYIGKDDFEDEFKWPFIIEKLGLFEWYPGALYKFVCDVDGNPTVVGVLEDGEYYMPTHGDKFKKDSNGRWIDVDGNFLAKGNMKTAIQVMIDREG